MKTLTRADEARQVLSAGEIKPAGQTCQEHPEAKDIREHIMMPDPVFPTDIIRQVRWTSNFSVTEEDLVSSDILGSKYGSIADVKMTRVGGGNLVKVMGWYDNEMGYTHMLVDHVIKTGETIE